MKRLNSGSFPDEDIIMANAFNYPNPASDHTWFTFEHNKPGEELQVNHQHF